MCAAHVHTVTSSPNRCLIAGPFSPFVFCCVFTTLSIRWSRLALDLVSETRVLAREQERQAAIDNCRVTIQPHFSSGMRYNYPEQQRTERAWIRRIAASVPVVSRTKNAQARKPRTNVFIELVLGTPSWPPTDLACFLFDQCI